MQYAWHCMLTYSLPVPIVMLSIPVTPVPPIMKGFAVINPTLALQVYSPDWILPNELTMDVLVYLVVFTITELVREVIITPTGPDIWWTVTFTGTSTNGLKSTVQVRVTVDPTGRMGLAGLLVITTTGFGTGRRERERERERANKCFYWQFLKEREVPEVLTHSKLMSPPLQSLHPSTVNTQNNIIIVN